MTEDHKAKMKAGRERARAEGKRMGAPKGTRKAKTPPADPVWTFNIDDKGALAIIDEQGEGIELKPDDAYRLRRFICRAIEDRSAP